MISSFKPINAQSSQKEPDNLGEIFKEKAKLNKYLKEKGLSEH